MHQLFFLNICTDCEFYSYGLVELTKEEKEIDIMVLATGKIKQLQNVLYSSCTQIIFG